MIDPHLISQSIVCITGAVSIWLLGRKEEWRRWGFIFGALGQPFWLYETYAAGQWGFFLVSIWYTYAWWQGIYNFWVKKS